MQASAQVSPSKPAPVTLRTPVAYSHPVHSCAL